MNEIPNGERGSTDQRGQEAVVNVAWQTDGALGGAFDGPGYTPGRWSFGLARPNSTVIWRVKLISFIAAIGLGILMVVSPLIMGLTVGIIPAVTSGIAAGAAIALIVFCSTYPAERRKILRRTSREYAEARAAVPTDVEVIDLLRGRDGEETTIRLSSGKTLRVVNIAWGYDVGDTYAHVTTNISPTVERVDVDVFSTEDLDAILDPQTGATLWSRPAS